MVVPDDDTRRFTPSTAVFPAETAAPGKLAGEAPIGSILMRPLTIVVQAYPAFSWAEDHLADALPPVVAFPGEMTCPPMSEAGSGRLLAVPLSLVATPSSLCTAPLQLESEPSVLLDRRECRYLCNVLIARTLTSHSRVSTAQHDN